MKKSRRMILGSLLAAALVSASSAPAQRTESVGGQSKTGDSSSSGSVTMATPPPAPATVKAKYEGGVVGYGKRDGTLTFDDVNNRLVFQDKKTGKEFLSMPYSVIVAAFADTQSRRPTAATVAASTVPYGLGLPALLFKKKSRYLTLNYRDPDTKAEGITSFKLENKEILASVLYTLGQKAGLTQRGDAFIRHRE